MHLTVAQWIFGFSEFVGAYVLTQLLTEGFEKRTFEAKIAREASATEQLDVVRRALDAAEVKHQQTIRQMQKLQRQHDFFATVGQRDPEDKPTAVEVVKRKRAEAAKNVIVEDMANGGPRWLIEEWGVGPVRSAFWSAPRGGKRYWY